MVKPERRAKPREILGIVTVAFGALGLLAMMVSLGSCWNEPLDRAGIGAPYDITFRFVGTVALVPFFFFAGLYIIVGWRQRARGALSYIGLFVGALSSLFVGLLLWWASLFEERKVPVSSQRVVVVLIVAFGIHALWTLIRWSREGRSRERMRALRWMGFVLIGLGVIGQVMYYLDRRTPDVTLKYYRARIAASSISVDGQQVATVDAKGKLVLWDVPTGKARWSSVRDLADSSSSVVPPPFS